MVGRDTEKGDGADCMFAYLRLHPQVGPGQTHAGRQELGWDLPWVGSPVDGRTQ